jgi:hypothetical protein
MTDKTLQKANNLNDSIKFINYVNRINIKNHDLILGDLDMASHPIIPNIIRNDLIIFLQEKQTEYKKQLSEL